MSQPVQDNGAGAMAPATPPSSPETLRKLRLWMLDEVVKTKADLANLRRMVTNGTHLGFKWDLDLNDFPRTTNKDVSLCVLDFIEALEWSWFKQLLEDKRNIEGRIEDEAIAKNQERIGAEDANQHDGSAKAKGPQEEGHSPVQNVVPLRQDSLQTTIERKDITVDVRSSTDDSESDTWTPATNSVLLEEIGEEIAKRAPAKGSSVLGIGTWSLSSQKMNQTEGDMKDDSRGPIDQNLDNSKLAVICPYAGNKHHLECKNPVCLFQALGNIQPRLCEQNLRQALSERLIAVAKLTLDEKVGIFDQLSNELILNFLINEKRRMYPDKRYNEAYVNCLQKLSAEIEVALPQPGEHISTAERTYWLEFGDLAITEAKRIAERINQTKSLLPRDISFNGAKEVKRRMKKRRDKERNREKSRSNDELGCSVQAAIPSSSNPSQDADGDGDKTNSEELVAEDVPEIFDFDSFMKKNVPEGSWTFENLSLHTVRATRDGCETYILKHISSYAKGARELDPQVRHRIESFALERQGNFPYEQEAQVTIAVPRRRPLCPSDDVLIMSDLGALLALSAAFNDLRTRQERERSEEQIVHERFSVLGDKVGTYFANLHKRLSPKDPEGPVSKIDRFFQKSRHNSVTLSHSMLEDNTANNYSDIIRAKSAMAIKDQLRGFNVPNSQELAQRVIEDFDTQYHADFNAFTHGDAYLSSIHLEKPISDTSRVGLIGWEHSGHGNGINGDLAQLLADLQSYYLEPNGTQAFRSIVKGFVTSLWRAYYTTSLGNGSTLVMKLQPDQYGPGTNRGIPDKPAKAMRSTFIAIGRELINMAHSPRRKCGCCSLETFGQCELVTRMVNIGVWYLENAGKDEKAFKGETWKKIQKQARSQDYAFPVLPYFKF
ncbi:uncharacterized protein PAC_08445 [Phialocephala subalpina]|uniref:Uncharacterized protein n=1 Tax=Phialocephala subalpina TaxID=576137 RepID=A0A1L7X0K2_9HELO|nr:uncharacterized protein PAC_08445 [Phialocephala subalpina]